MDRGHYKVFLGMAAGVGKTYRMLQEGRAEAAAGRDVVIGYLEPHDRPETSEQAGGPQPGARRGGAVRRRAVAARKGPPAPLRPAPGPGTGGGAGGLEPVTRREVSIRGGAIAAEMDLPALLARAPELALIDELAHTNPPGLEHGKRYEDIADVLAAGIDVFSTVNVQHLESLNDQVASLTGTRVRETFPDSVLAQADEVVLIDLTPQALIERLQAGKVYPPARVASALNGFFRVEHLEALREVALRQVAEDVEAKRLRFDLPPREGRLAEQAVGERLLAL